MTKWPWRRPSRPGVFAPLAWMVKKRQRWRKMPLTLGNPSRRPGTAFWGGFSGFISWFMGFFTIFHLLLRGTCLMQLQYTDHGRTCRPFKCAMKCCECHTAVVMNSLGVSTTRPVSCTQWPNDKTKMIVTSQNITVLSGHLRDPPGLRPGKGHFLDWDSAFNFFLTGHAGGARSSGLGLDGFPTKCSCRHISRIFIFEFCWPVGAYIFRTPHCSSDDLRLAAAFRLRGFLRFNALLLQAWSGIGVYEQKMGTEICGEHNTI